MQNLREFNKLVQEVINERKPKKRHQTKLSVFRVILCVATKKWLACFIKIVFRVTLVCFKIRGKDAVRPLPAVCVLSLSREQLFKGKSEEDLLEFFKEERFGNLNGEILIETKSLRVSKSKSKSYKTSISVDLLFNRLVPAQKREVLKLSEYLINSYLKSLDLEEKAHLRTIYALFELAVWFVIREEEITLITTQSSMTLLPVSFRIQNSRFMRKMLWYSTNSQPIVKELSLIGRHEFGEGLSGNVDMHYVWDLDSKKFLESNGISRVSAVGSILFEKPETVILKNRGFSLIYFDVTPIENANTFYTVERMCTNLCALIDVVERLSMETEQAINLIIKPKRGVKKSHSRRYIELLATFEKEGKIQLIDPHMNLYGLIRNADSVIGIPFTSPVVVGRELGIPSAFMDVHTDEYFLPGQHNEFPVLTNQNLVITWLREFILAKSTN